MGYPIIIVLSCRKVDSLVTASYMRGLHRPFAVHVGDLPGGCHACQHRLDLPRRRRREFNGGMTFPYRNAVASLLLVLAGSAAAQQLATKKALTLEVAKKVAAAAEAEAAKNKFTMYIT